MPWSMHIRGQYGVNVGYHSLPDRRTSLGDHPWKQKEMKIQKKTDGHFYINSPYDVSLNIFQIKPDRFPIIHQKHKVQSQNEVTGIE